ncbi:large ribosomal subunit protein uL18m-like [Dysidea avara]|uniref:large ribosomal subunit protein uL18m-like n=1 Tax=Dysidea avara TaxID=196820 RepID=UPI003327FAB6
MVMIKLQLEITNYHITGSVTHNNGTTVVEASTREFCIARHLFKTTDVSASHNIGRVVSFISGVRSEGLLLNEPKFSEKEML